MRSGRGGRLLLLGGLVAVAALETACGTCRGGSPVRMRPGVGGSIGSSGATTWTTPGVGLDLSNVLCRPPDPATMPQPGPGSPPIQDPPAAAPAKPSGELPASATPL